MIDKQPSESFSSLSSIALPAVFTELVVLLNIIGFNINVVHGLVENIKMKRIDFIGVK